MVPTLLITEYIGNKRIIISISCKASKVFERS